MKRVKIIALLSALLAAGLLFIFLADMSKKNDVKKTSVVVATQRIPINTTIGKSMLTLSDIHPDAVLSGAAGATGDIVGKMNRIEIFPGEQIIADKLIAPGETGSGVLAYEIKPGMRAVTVSVDINRGLANMLKPKDRIDIIGEFKSQKSGISIFKIIFQNVNILAVDSSTKKEDRLPYTTITLEVTPSDALKLVASTSQGKLTAILRSPKDTDEVRLKRITVNDVIADK